MNSETILESLSKKLKETELEVFYGIADGDNNLAKYIVYGRDTIVINENKLGFTDKYEVVIVCENYISQELIDDVIEKVEQCGLRLSNENMEFSYFEKKDIVMELLRIKFIRARRRH
ncbi:hypothetical protein [uncultured Eubacterium sp.]|uniref:hypothetical protein n=1 Tax=uncultured Eubacterium sp. TaxID=165185 RepID=UPI002670DA3A|nr:hypothetical protein [uncultured Eubacterium sp.]